MCEILLRHKADPNPPVSRKPVFYAAAYNHVDLCGLLHSSRADLNAIDAHGDTPLICAVRNKCVDSARFLLEHGADVQPRNKVGLAAPDMCLHRQTRRHPVDSGSEVPRSLLLQHAHRQYRGRVELLCCIATCCGGCYLLCDDLLHSSLLYVIC